MDMSIALILGQDGITNGAIYALLALALVVVFRATGQLNFAQGEIGPIGHRNFLHGYTASLALFAERDL